MCRTASASFPNTLDDIRSSLNQAIARFNLIKRHQMPTPTSCIATPHRPNTPTTPPILDCGAQSTSMPLSTLHNSHNPFPKVTAVLPNGSTITSLGTTPYHYNGLTMTANVYAHKQESQSLNPTAPPSSTTQNHNHHHYGLCRPQIKFHHIISFAATKKHRAADLISYPHMHPSPTQSTTSSNTQ